MSQRGKVADRFQRTREMEVARREQDEIDRKEREREHMEGLIGRHSLIDNGEGPSSRRTYRRCEASGCRHNEPAEPRPLVDSFLSSKPSTTSDVLEGAVDEYLTPAELDGNTSMAGPSQKMRTESADIGDHEFDLPSEQMNKGKATVIEETDSEAEQDLRIRDVKLEKQQLQHDIKEKEKQIEAYEGELSEARAKLIDAREDVEEWQERCERAKQLIDTLEEERKELRMKLQAAEERECELRRELRRASSRAENAKDEYDRQIREEKKRGENHKFEADVLRRQLEIIQQTSALQQSDTREVAGPQRRWGEADEWYSLTNVADVENSKYLDFNEEAERYHRRRTRNLEIRSHRPRGEKRPRHEMVRRASKTEKLLFG